MREYLVLGIWSLLAGAGIPLIGVLNSGLTRSIGNPFAATAVMFAIAMLAAIALTLAVFGAPAVSKLASSSPLNYAAGLLIGFYALSATIIIPRFGAARFIAFIVVAQIVTSATIDHYGLFGIPRRPLDLAKAVGLAVIVGGILIMQISSFRNPQ